MYFLLDLCHLSKNILILKYIYRPCTYADKSNFISHFSIFLRFSNGFFIVIIDLIVFSNVREILSRNWNLWKRVLLGLLQWKIECNKFFRIFSVFKSNISLKLDTIFFGNVIFIKLQGYILIVIEKKWKESKSYLIYNYCSLPTLLLLCVFSPKKILLLVQYYWQFNFYWRFKCQNELFFKLFCFQSEASLYSSEWLWLQVQLV